MKQKPDFTLYVPTETRAKFFKLRSNLCAVMADCAICGAVRPWCEIHNAFNKGACNECMVKEFGKGD